MALFDTLSKGLRGLSSAQGLREWLGIASEFNDSIERAEERLGTIGDALEGSVQVRGPEAVMVGKLIDKVFRSSITFRRTLERCMAEGETFAIKTGYAGREPSWSTMGRKNERMFINLDQASGKENALIALLVHEFGHGAANLKDGAKLGDVGPNQIWTSGVLAEMGFVDSTIERYGEDLRLYKQDIMA